MVAVALAAFRASRADPAGGGRANSGAGLLEAVDALGVLRAAVDAVTLDVLGELERAASVGGEENPVVKAGHRTTASLLAELWRIGYPAAQQLCTVADATRPRSSLLGEELPARYPLLAVATRATLTESGDNANAGADTDAGTDSVVDADTAAGKVGGVLDPPIVSVDQAVVIIRELEKTMGCAREQVTIGERLLVEQASSLTVGQLRRVAVQVRDRLDQDGIEPREALRRRRRSLTITTTRDGLTHVDWYLDPESAGHVIPAIHAYVGADLRHPRFHNPARTAEPDTAEPGTADSDGGTIGADEVETPETPDTTGAATATGPIGVTDALDRLDGGIDADLMGGAGVMPESRSMGQIRSDAAVEVFRHVAGCDRAGDDRPPVTMLIRINLTDLHTGVGVAQIDGIDEPVSAATARRLAVDANLIPAVLGGHSEVLDLGRAKRWFSTAQKHALAERDDGCAWAGCPHPPRYTEAHHIRWWHRDTGPTNLANGILLCSNHHHRVHADGWDIHIHDNIPWFTPPPHIDPTRKPRRGGRIRVAA